MDKEELYKYAYVKKPLNEIYKDSSSVDLHRSRYSSGLKVL